MTEALTRIEQRIEEGFVFDEQGRWMHMAELRIYEKRVVEQLAGGNVFVGGKWIPISAASALAKRERAAQEAKRGVPDVDWDGAGVDNMLETVCISTPAARPSAPGVDAGTDKNTGADNTSAGNIRTDNAGANSIRADNVGGGGTNAGGVTATIDFSGADDLRETACLTIERIAQPGAARPAPALKINTAGANAAAAAPVIKSEAAPASPEAASKVVIGADSAKAGANPEKTPKSDPVVDAEEVVDGVLLFGLSKSAAVEHSKYAMEYIEELNRARKRRGLVSGFAIASVLLAAAAAVTIAVLQHMGF